MRSTHWSWLNTSLIGLARVAMRVCWLTPCIELLSYDLLRLDRPLIPTWLLGLILLGSCALTSLIAHSQPATNQTVPSRAEKTVLRRWQLFIAGLGLGLLLWLLWWRLYRPTFSIWDSGWVEHLVRDLTSWRGMLGPLSLMLMGAYLWWRGLTDGRIPPWHETLFGSFSVGLSWLVALAVVSHYWPTLRPPSLWPAALGFVISSLAGLALVDLDEVRRRGGAAARNLLTINRYWLLTTLTTIGLITLSGLALTYLAAPSRIEALLEILTGLLDFVADLLIPVILYLILIISYPLFLILTPLMRALSRLFRLWMSESSQEPLQDQFTSQFEQLQGRGAQIPSWLDVTAKATFLVLLVGGIGLAFALALRRHTRRDEEGVEETRELIWSVEMMKDEWRALIQRLRRRRRGVRKAQSPFLSLGGVEPDRRVIRQVYQQLLAWAGDRGLRRPPGATPHEYAAMLEDHYSAAEWRTITEAYAQARYMVDPLPPGLADQVQADWSRLFQGWQEGARRGRTADAAD
jgi:hypothetical protein